jgi:hypothetical protein
VVYSKTGFFYDKGRPRGMVADAANELEMYLNKKLKTGAKKFKVAVTPVTRRVWRRTSTKGLEMSSLPASW